MVDEGTAAIPDAAELSDAALAQLQEQITAEREKRIRLTYMPIQIAELVGEYVALGGDVDELNTVIHARVVSVTV